MNKPTDKKYRIREILDRLPYMERKAMRTALVQRLGIHPNTFYAMMGYRTDDRFSISVDKMQIIAEMLQVTVDDLLTPTSHIKN